jgi:hypothetical protein
LARRLGDILIEERLITPAQRDEALRQQRLYGGRIGTNLFELGAIDLEGLARALSRQKGVPAALQKHFDSIHGEAVALVPARLAQKHAAIPLGFTARSPKTIAVAFLDPARPGAVDEIQFAASARVYPVVAPELRIYLYLEKIYGIPRHVRFLRLDRASVDAAGRWSPRSTPTSEHTPPFLSAPETPPEGIPAADPKAIFDMSRPDLSQSRNDPDILLTEALRKEPTPAKSPGPAAQTSSPARSSVSAAAGRSASRAQTNPDVTAGRGAPKPAPPPSTPVAAADAAAKKPRRESTPPPLPSRLRAGSGSPPSSASRESPMGYPSATSPPSHARPASTSSAPTSSPVRSSRHSPPTPIGSAGAALPQRADVVQRTDRDDASSRAPTIREIPTFAIHQTGPAHVERGSSSTAPTIKIDEGFELLSPSAEPVRDSRFPELSIADDWPAPLLLTVRGSPEPDSQDERVPSGAWDKDELGPASIAQPASSQASEAPEHSSEPTRAATEEALATNAAASLPAESFQQSEISGARSPSALAQPSPSISETALRPWSAAEAADAMATAGDRDAIADAILNYLRATCGVGLVLIVQHEVAMGWKGFAPGASPQEIDALAIPLAAPSLLHVAYRRQTVFRGPPPSEGAALDGQLWAKLRSPQPKEAIVAPIAIRDRVVNLVYGHAADGGPLPDRLLVGLSTLVRAASAAYVRLIQDAKKKDAS